MWDTDNMYLNGPYTPWRQEGVAFDLQIEGELPSELSGALFMTSASSLYQPIEPNRLHWFDGDGMVYGIYLREGRATFRNRYVATAGLKLEMQEGRAVFGGLMNGMTNPVPPPAGGPFFKNPANTNVALFDDRLLVFAEVDVPHELRPDNLETVNERYDFKGAVSGPVTAHFKVDPDNGDMLFFGAFGTEVTWYRADRHGNVLDTHKIDIGVPALLHDYVVTDDYAIFLVSPSMWRVENLMRGLPAAVWEPETLEVTRFAVMHRRSGKVQWIDAPDTFMQTHFFNAYQEGSTVIIDGQRTDRFGMTADEIKNTPSDGDWNKWFREMRAAPWRWELNLETGGFSQKQLTDLLGEFPRINDQHAGRAHRFGYYATTRDADRWLTDGLAKHDFLADRTELKTIPGLTAPNEPVFVPREGATAEDDGWVLSTWYDAAQDRSEVVVQNAQDFTGTPVARIKLNHRMPLGFHGNWAPGAELDAAISKG
ncbi:carotenoid oxygenase family protein [Streptomyces sp. NPDC101776]|uniref:carotenoid oxygenase family protein n=1 Tax=Streptomyces sp. NPDC101776 TaxID=3366146 RepID=UPI0037F73FBF